jgi:hypothetical protein
MASNRVQALVNLARPVRAGELQQFMGAVRWMRMYLPEYTRLVELLHDILPPV